MSNPKIVFSESGFKYTTYSEYMLQRLKQSAKNNVEYLNLYKVVKKLRRSMPKKGKKYSIRKVFKVTNVTDKSFTIS
jgi:hypothetical protein